MFTFCIAEDEYYVQKSIDSRIRSMNMGFVCGGFAFTGLDAEELYDRVRPDLFFVDINMPQCSGFQFIEKIREKDPDCQTLFIIISGYSDYQNMQKAIRVEVFDYLQKPIVPEEFAAMIRRAVQSLERRKPETGDSGMEDLFRENAGRETGTGTGYGQEGEDRVRLPASGGDEINRRIERICDYMRQHYREEITARLLGDVFYLSPGYIAHLFKNKMGTTPGKYLEDVRLEQAYRMLRNTQLKVSEVAEQTGYKDGNYFTKCFRKKYGVSPSEIRKNRKK